MRTIRLQDVPDEDTLPVIQPKRTIRLQDVPDAGLPVIQPKRTISLSDIPDEPQNPAPDLDAMGLGSMYTPEQLAEPVRPGPVMSATDEPVQELSAMDKLRGIGELIWALPSIQLNSMARQAAPSPEFQQAHPFIAAPVEGVSQGVQDIAGVTVRGGGSQMGSAFSDAMNRAQGNREQQVQKIDEQAGHPWGPGIIRGTTRSLASAVPAGVAGGPYAAIGMATAQQVSQAITQGKDKGLTGNDLYAYVATQGALEGGIASAFQAVGAGGMEKIFKRKEVRNVIQRGVKDALKNLGKDTVAELTEENLTTLGQSLTDWAMGVNEEALLPQLYRGATDTTAQTLLTMGLTRAPGLAGATRQSMQDRGKFDVNDPTQVRMPDGSVKPIAAVTDEEWKSLGTRDAVRRDENGVFILDYSNAPDFVVDPNGPETMTLSPEERARLIQQWSNVPEERVEASLWAPQGQQGGGAVAMAPTQQVLPDGRVALRRFADRMQQQAEPVAPEAIQQPATDGRGALVRFAQRGQQRREETPVTPVEQPVAAEPPSAGMPTQGWRTPVRPGQEQIARIQGSGLPNGTFYSLDAPFQSGAHDASQAKRENIPPLNAVYDPEGILGEPTPNLQQEMLAYIIKHPTSDLDETRQSMTDFLISKGFDGYVRLIDGQKGNRELIVFDKPSGSQTAKSEPQASLQSTGEPQNERPVFTSKDMVHMENPVRHDNWRFAGEFVFQDGQTATLYKTPEGYAVADPNEHGNGEIVRELPVRLSGKEITRFNGYKVSSGQTINQYRQRTEKPKAIHAEKATKPALPKWKANAAEAVRSAITEIRMASSGYFNRKNDRKRVNRSWDTIEKNAAKLGIKITEWKQSEPLIHWMHQQIDVIESTLPTHEQAMEALSAPKKTVPKKPQGRRDRINDVVAQLLDIKPTEKPYKPKVERNEALAEFRQEIRRAGMRPPKDLNMVDDFGGKLPPGYWRKDGRYTYDLALQIAAGEPYNLIPDDSPPHALRDLLIGSTFQEVEPEIYYEQQETDDDVDVRPVKDLAEGDLVYRDGEWHMVTDMEATGDTVLQDGDTTVVESDKSLDVGAVIRKGSKHYEKAKQLYDAQRQTEEWQARRRDAESTRAEDQSGFLFEDGIPLEESAQQAIQLYGSKERAVQKLKGQRAVLKQEGRSTAAVDRVIAQLETQSYQPTMDDYDGEEFPFDVGQASPDTARRPGAPDVQVAGRGVEQVRAAVGVARQAGIMDDASADALDAWLDSVDAPVNVRVEITNEVRSITQEEASKTYLSEGDTVRGVEAPERDAMGRVVGAFARIYAGHNPGTAIHEIAGHVVLDLADDSVREVAAQHTAGKNWTELTPEEQRTVHERLADDVRAEFFQPGSIMKTKAVAQYRSWVRRIAEFIRRVLRRLSKSGRVAMKYKKNVQLAAQGKIAELGVGRESSESLTQRREDAKGERFDAGARHEDGRRNVANPGGKNMVNRMQFDAMDMAIEQAGMWKHGMKKKVVARQGEALVRQPGFLDDIAERMRAGYQINEAEDYAVRKLMNKRMTSQLDNLDEVRKNIEYHAAWRTARSKAAALLGNFHDVAMKPGQRILWGINEVIYEPTQELAKVFARVAATLEDPNSTAKEKAKAIIEERKAKEQQVKDTKDTLDALKEKGIDMEGLSDHIDQHYSRMMDRNEELRFASEEERQAFEERRAQHDEEFDGIDSRMRDRNTELRFASEEERQAFEERRAKRQADWAVIAPWLKRANIPKSILNALSDDQRALLEAARRVGPDRVEAFRDAMMAGMSEEQYKAFFRDSLAAMSNMPDDESLVLDTTKDQAEFTSKFLEGLNEQQLQEFRDKVEAMRKQLFEGAEADTASQDQLFPRRLEDELDMLRKLSVAWSEAAAQKNTVMTVAHYWYLSARFSGQGTQEANIIGNTVWNGYQLTVRRIAEAVFNEYEISRGRGDLVGAPRVSLEEIEHVFKGLWPGIVRGARSLLDGFKYEAPLFSLAVSGKATTKLDEMRLGSPEIRPKSKAGKVAAVPFNLASRALFKVGLNPLLAFDEFNKAMRCEIEVPAIASRIADREGLTGEQKERRVLALTGDLDSEAWDVAFRMAERDTFQEALPRAGKAIQHFQQNFPGAKWFLLVLKTPWNLLKFSTKMAGLNAGAVAYRHGRAALIGTRNQQERSQLLQDKVEMFFATALWAAIGYAVGAYGGDDREPLFTGSAPVEIWDKSRRDLKARTLPAKSFRIPGTDRWLYYGRIDPFAATLAFMADSWGVAKDAKNGLEFENAMAAIGKKTFANVKSIWVLRSLSDLVDAFNSPVGAFDYAVLNPLSGFVPNFIQQPLRDLDPVVRDQSLRGEDSEWWARKLAKTSYRFLPIGPVLKPQYTPWGEEIKKTSPTGTAATDFLLRVLSPVQDVTPDWRNPGAAKLDRMINNWNNYHFGKGAFSLSGMPDGQFVPGAPDDTFTVGGKSYKMSAGEYERMQKRSGELALQWINPGALKESEINSPSADNINLVKVLLEKAREAARREIIASRDWGVSR